MKQVIFGDHFIKTEEEQEEIIRQLFSLQIFPWKLYASAKAAEKDETNLFPYIYRIQITVEKIQGEKNE